MAQKWLGVWGLGALSKVVGKKQKRMKQAPCRRTLNC